MIFTIGHKESYDQYFQEQSNPQKLGRTEDYTGGSVWLTIEEALRHCSEEHAVYGVLADWAIDTAPSKDGDWHDLLVTSTLVMV